MKVVIILLGFLAAVAFADDGKVLFSKCADFKLQYPELKAKVHLHHVLGPWNMIRKGPLKHADKLEKYDCIRQVYWQSDKTEAGKFDFLTHARNASGHNFCTGTVAYTGLESNQVDNLFQNKFKDPENPEKEIEVESVLIDTDNGETWGLWANCMEFEPTNHTVVWGIASRFPWIDARVEQKLVERIEKYGGVGPTQLRGVGQTDCYKFKE